MSGVSPESLTPHPLAGPAQCGRAWERKQDAERAPMPTVPRPPRTGAGRSSEPWSPTSPLEATWAQSPRRLVATLAPARFS